MVRVEDLSPAAIEQLRSRLEDLEHELVYILDATVKNEEPVDLDQPIGRLSRIDAIQQQKMQSASRAAQKIQLAQVRRAIQAVADDEYGFCRRCEEQIAVRRLQIQPEAPFCVRCQSAREQRL